MRHFIEITTLAQALRVIEPSKMQAWAEAEARRRKKISRQGSGPRPVGRPRLLEFPVLWTITLSLELGKRIVDYRGNGTWSETMRALIATALEVTPSEIASEPFEDFQHDPRVTLKVSVELEALQAFKERFSLAQREPALAVALARLAGAEKVRPTADPLEPFYPEGYLEWRATGKAPEAKRAPLRQRTKGS